MTDDLDNQRKRLYFRSIRRGTKESDLVIGGFAEANLAAMNAEQLDQFEALLNENDPEVLAWIVGLTDPPAEFDNEVLEALRKFKNSMPSDRV
jgi:antitoxin CptB